MTDRNILTSDRMRRDRVLAARSFMSAHTCVSPYSVTMREASVRLQALRAGWTPDEIDEAVEAEETLTTARYRAEFSRRRTYALDDFCRGDTIPLHMYVGGFSWPDGHIPLALDESDEGPRPARTEIGRKPRKPPPSPLSLILMVLCSFLVAVWIAVGVFR